MSALRTRDDGSPLIFFFFCLLSGIPSQILSHDHYLRRYFFVHCPHELLTEEVTNCLVAVDPVVDRVAGPSIRRTRAHSAQAAGRRRGRRSWLVRGGFAGHMAASHGLRSDTAAMAPYWAVDAGYRALTQPFDSIGPGTAPPRIGGHASDIHGPRGERGGRRQQLDPRRIKEGKKSRLGGKGASERRRMSPGRPTTRVPPLASPPLYYHHPL